MFSPHLYLMNAPIAEYSSAQRALVYLLRQRSCGVEPVLSLNHLSSIVFADRFNLLLPRLEMICDREIDPYSAYQVKKAGGGFREIAEPDDYLKQVQRWILHRILDRLPVSEYAFAYVKGRSPIACARQHVGAKWAVRVDVESFFDNFSEREVFGLFKAVGMPRLMAFQLARLCTREVGVSSKGESGAFGLPHPRRSGETVLPQGAPTSGALSNLLFGPVDHLIGDWARERGFVYTRYSDDIWCSGFGKMSGRSLHFVKSHLIAELRAHGYTANLRKVRVVTSKFPIEILGARVDGEKLCVRQGDRQYLDRVLLQIAKVGLSKTADVMGVGVGKLRERIAGKIDYIRAIDSDLGARYRNRFRELRAQEGLL